MMSASVLLIYVISLVVSAVGVTMYSESKWYKHRDKVPYLTPPTIVGAIFTPAVNTLIAAITVLVVLLSTARYARDLACALRAMYSNKTLF